MSDSDLSDVLRDMADDRRPNARAGDDDSNEPEAPDEMVEASEASDASDVPDDLAAVGEQIGDESGEVVGASPAAGGAAGRAERSRRGDRGMQAAAVPVLITVGLMLIALGAWGTAVVNDYAIILSDRPRAEQMARAMMVVGYPLGVCLFAGAGFFIYQLRRH